MGRKKCCPASTKRHNKCSGSVTRTCGARRLDRKHWPLKSSKAFTVPENFEFWDRSLIRPNSRKISTARWGRTWIQRRNVRFGRLSTQTMVWLLFKKFSSYEIIYGCIIKEKIIFWRIVDENTVNYHLLSKFGIKIRKLSLFQKSGDMSLNSEQFSLRRPKFW